MRFALAILFLPLAATAAEKLRFNRCVAHIYEFANALGTAIGAGAGGKKGALIGAGVGAGGSALYTYGLRDRSRRY